MSRFVLSVVRKRGFGAGMAGSGKTTLVQRFTQHLQASKNENYVINLDPAVHSLPYHANIDIRDTVRSSTIRLADRTLS